MGRHREFAQAMESGTRPTRRWRVLLAHDTSSSTCDGLIAALESVLGHVEILDASSVEGALALLYSARESPPDVCFVCLDLPPAPAGGVRLAKEILAAGSPVVLVTRSLRWLPRDAGSLRDVPWVAPDAERRDVARAVGDAVAASAAADPEATEIVGTTSRGDRRSRAGA